MPARIKNGVIDSPVPGQSLTGEMGQFPWERPAQYADPAEAADVIWQRLSKPVNITKALTLIDAGTPIIHISESILYAGVDEGQWSLDAAAALITPVTMMLMGMADVAKIDYSVWEEGPDDDDVQILQMAQTAHSIKKEKNKPVTDAQIKAATSFVEQNKDSGVTPEAEQHAQASQDPTAAMPTASPPEAGPKAPPPAFGLLGGSH